MEQVAQSISLFFVASLTGVLPQLHLITMLPPPSAFCLRFLVPSAITITLPLNQPNTPRSEHLPRATQGRTKRMQAGARMASVASSTTPARRLVIQNQRNLPTPIACASRSSGMCTGRSVRQSGASDAFLLQEACEHEAAGTVFVADAQLLVRMAKLARELLAHETSTGTNRLSNVSCKDDDL